MTSFVEYLYAEKMASGNVINKLDIVIQTNGSFLNERSWQVMAHIKWLKNTIAQIPRMPLNGRNLPFKSLGRNIKYTPISIDMLAI